MGNPIIQSAGRCRIRVYTDGSPLWSEIEIEANNGTMHEVRIGVEELHDLRYCIDRVLQQLGNPANG